jgi:threonine dehydrogenase-like Zn-dependent dehydrogenase
VSENTGYVCGKCFACLTGQYLLCPERRGLGYSMDGGFAEYVRIPEQILQRMPDCLHRLPDSLSFQEGAILEPSANSYKTVIQEGGLMAGETIAIFGPGPIGIFCVQLAKVAGASQIILIGRSSSQMRLEQGKRFGADMIIFADQQDVREAIHSVTKGEGVDLVIDAAGAEEVMAHAMSVIRPAGRIVRIAWGNAVQNIDLDPLSSKAGTIQGHFGYDSVSWRNVLRMAEKGMIQYKAMISKVFSLDQWQEAFEMVEKKTVMKTVFEL